MKAEYIFFLGGHDAEMMTIKELLTENNVPEENILDKNLKWGAKLSDYKTELSKLSTEQTPVFIELNLDIEYPLNSVIVDHHNEKAGKDKKTSIEQVASLLGVIMNREQELISANDKGFIWGMLDIGATEEEILRIRKLDMEEQRVTDEDKEKAKISIDHFLERISNDCIIVNSLIEKSTPIIELVYKYYRHIFIITPSNKLSYTGTEQIIRILENKYALLKKDNSKIETWSGGYLPEHGYFGSSDAINIKEIIKLMEPFIKEERIHSQHIFMFPFNIVHDNIKECKCSYNRMHTIHDMIEKSNSGWKYCQFKILQTPLEYVNDKGEETKREKYSPDEVWFYSEYKYFHEYVRETLFNTKKIDELFPQPNDNLNTKKEKETDQQNYDQPISLYYEREILPADEMTIFIRKNDNGKKEIIIYTLKVEHLSLRIFETGIGILSVTLYNYCSKDFDSILRINDFGRRIYPQFLAEQNEYSPNPIDAVKDSFLPEKIVFKASGIDTTDIFETDDYLSEKKHFACYIEELLKPFHDSKKSKLAITPIIDDRMFVVCWHENDEVINEIKRFTPNQFVKVNERTNSSEGSYTYENNAKWYQYAFLDGTVPLVQNRIMKEELIKNVTYARFIESDASTLYAITRYSFVCLCNVDGFLYSVIRNHMQKAYYQMSVLLLAQRASILKFNKELENISEDADKLIIENKKSRKYNKNKNDLISILDRAEKLNKDIILFSNRIWFDEVTPQEQGIEIYALALKKMDIKNQYDSLRVKVHQLHDFIRIKLEHQKTSKIENLTAISIVFAVIVCVFTFWAIDFSFLKYWEGYKAEYNFYSMLRSLVMFFSSAGAIVSFFLLIFHKSNFISLKKRTKNFALAILIIAFVVFFFFYLF